MMRARFEIHVHGGTPDARMTAERIVYRIDFGVRRSEFSMEPSSEYPAAEDNNRTYEGIRADCAGTLLC